MVNKPLILIDCNNACHIALHTMGELSHLDMKTGVIFGLFVRLMKLWDEFGSNRFVFCWDSRKRFRSALYPEYKRNREKASTLTPAERVIISEQMQALRCEILPAMGFRNQLHQTGYEGDDMIAHAALNCKSEFVVVSTDKDLFQLLAIAACRFVYNTVTKKKMTRELFKQTYRVEPFEWVKVKALAGDGGDNIPGVPGVAEKTAAAFVLDELKGKKLEAIHANAELIARNIRLIRLPFEQEGFPVNVPPLQRDELSVDRFIDVFDRHGFQSFLKPDKLEKWRKFADGCQV